MPSEFVGIRVDGVRRLRNTMARAGVDMSADLKALNQEALDVVLPVAKANAPVADAYGGDLKASVRGSATKAAATIRAGSKKAPYGGVVHYGVPTGFTDILGRPKRMNAQPWIAEAAQSTENQWVERYWDGLLKIINTIEGE